MYAAKRRKLVPCCCPACNNELRDIRTVERHALHSYTTTITEPSSPTRMPECMSDPRCENCATSNESSNDDIITDAAKCSNASAVFELTEENVTSFIMKEAKAKLQSGLSVQEIEEHLRNAAQLLGDDVIPSKWTDVLKVMENAGYKAPQHYKVCVSSSHSFLLKSKKIHPICPTCGKTWSDCLDYYCLGLDFCNWFSSRDQCQKLMAHWEQTDEWFNRQNDYQPPSQSELWHGRRFRELSWFWDSSKQYLLPEKCPRCLKIIPTKYLQSNGGNTNLQCMHCSGSFTYFQSFVHGDPRNQVVIIHEDGWSPHSTSSAHSIAAITITHGCMSKLNRSYGSNVRVYSFIPTHMLPKSTPHKYDAFFQPLIEEIEELFINGEEVYFAGMEGDAEQGTFPNLRILPLLVTADSKAHCEIGLTKAGGFRGCRRCFVSGIYVPEKKHYYYGNFRYRYRNPCENRDPNTNRQYGISVDTAATKADKQAISKDTGVTGECIFYRLYDLCGFNPVNDLTIDAMHAMVLNLIKTELEVHLLADLGENSTRPIQDRKPNCGGLLDRKDLTAALEKVQWTAELKDGRVPTLSAKCHGKSKLGHWKSEQFGKFIMVAPIVLRGLIPEKAYRCFCLLSEMYYMVFCEEKRIEGWSPENVRHFKKLIWKHAIQFEEFYGLSACTENLEYSTHMPEDIEHFSTLDNYWCYVYERQVRYYKLQKTNQKYLCKTFADRASQLRFVNLYLDLKLQSPSPPNTPNSLLCHKGILMVRTISEAIELKEYVSCNPDSLSEMKLDVQDGIMVGKERIITLEAQQKNDIAFWIRKDEAMTVGTTCDSVISSTAFAFKKMVKMNSYNMAHTFRIGEYVVVKDAGSETVEWIAQITSFIAYGPVNDVYKHYFDAVYYAAKTLSDGSVDMDEWTGQAKLVIKHYRQLCIQPIR